MYLIRCIIGPMSNVVPDSDVKVRTLSEYLKAQGRLDIADLLVDATITEENDPGLFSALFDLNEYKLYLNVSPTVFHRIETEAEVKKVLEKSFLAVMPTHRKRRVFKVGFRILSV